MGNRMRGDRVFDQSRVRHAGNCGLVYSALLSFVLSSAAYNRRTGVAHPPILTAVGYVLCGLSAGAAGLLPVWAAYNPAGAAALGTLSLTI